MNIDKEQRAALSLYRTFFVTVYTTLIKQHERIRKLQNATRSTQGDFRMRDAVKCVRMMGKTEQNSLSLLSFALRIA